MSSRSAVLLAGALLIVAGCNSQSQQPYESANTFFAEENEARLPRQVAEQQATIGAQADPTLYACHFDGTALNDLGRTKLDMILAQGGPTVYVDTPRDSAQAHRAAVNAYLSASKVADGSVAIETGAVAPGSSHPAGPSMQRLIKTENPRGGSGYNRNGADDESSSSSSSSMSGTKLFGD